MPGAKRTGAVVVIYSGTALSIIYNAERDDAN